MHRRKQCKDKKECSSGHALYLICARSALSIAYLLAVKARYSNPGVTHVGHVVCACQSKQHCDKNSARTAWLTCITPGLLYLA